MLPDNFLLVDVATSSWHAPERERERYIYNFRQLACCQTCNTALSFKSKSWKACELWTIQIIATAYRTIGNI